MTKSKGSRVDEGMRTVRGALPAAPAGPAGAAENPSTAFSRTPHGAPRTVSIQRPGNMPRPATAMKIEW